MTPDQVSATIANAVELYKYNLGISEAHKRVWTEEQLKYEQMVVGWWASGEITYEQAVNRMVRAHPEYTRNRLRERLRREMQKRKLSDSSSSNGMA